MSKETASPEELGVADLWRSELGSGPRALSLTVCRPLCTLPRPPLTSPLAPSTFLSRPYKALRGPGLKGQAVPWAEEPV